MGIARMRGCTSDHTMRYNLATPNLISSYLYESHITAVSNARTYDPQPLGEHAHIMSSPVDVSLLMSCCNINDRVSTSCSWPEGVWRPGLLHASNRLL